MKVFYYPVHSSSFSIYDVSINYPREWKISVGENSDFNNGEIDIVEPEKKAIITILWRPKEELIESIKGERKVKRGLFGLFAKPSPPKIDLEEIPLLDAYKEIVWYKLREGVKNVELVYSREVEICGHRAYLEQIVFKAVTTFLLLKKVSGVVRRIQLLLICDRTNRNFAVFGSALDEDFERLENVINEIILSFKCHS